MKVDLSTYAAKADLKYATGINTSKLVGKSDLVNLKAEIDKLHVDKLKSVPTSLSNLKSKVDNLDIGKLETTPIDLSKLSNLVKNDAVKRIEYRAKIKNIDDKTPDITNLATKTTLSAKINEVKAEYQVLLTYILLLLLLLLKIKYLML